MSGAYIPTLVDGPWETRPGIPFADWWDRVRRGEREFVLPTAAGPAGSGEPRAASDPAPVTGPTPAPPTPTGVGALRARILAAAPAAELVDVPEWGDATVEVRCFDGSRLFQWSQVAVVPRVQGAPLDPDVEMAVLLTLTVHDPISGRPIFDQPGDLAAILALDGRGLERVYKAARRVAHV